MEIMGYGVGEEGSLVAYGKVINVQRETVHGFLIYERCMVVEVHKSEDNEYVLFRSVKIDDPPIRKIGNIVKNFIL